MWGAQPFSDPRGDGKHVLTDSFASSVWLPGLGLVMLTGWKPFDPRSRLPPTSCGLEDV
jgi:hypothetical protein